MASLLVVALLVPFLVPIPDELERIRSLRALGVLAHFGLPAVLALILSRWGPLRGRLFAAGAVAFALAAGCEILQNFVPRHPRWLDVGVDLSGVVLMVGWIRWRERRDGRWLAACAVGVLVLVSQTYSIPGFLLAERQARENFPVLGDFETSTQMALWQRNEGGHGYFERVRLDDGNHVLSLHAAPHHLYPGAIARGLPRDWSGYSMLSFRARLAKGTKAQLTVRLDDFASRADFLWCGRHMQLDEQWRTYDLDLEGAAAGVQDRPFRLDDIDSLLLYLTGVEDGVTVLIDDIVLR